MGRSGGDNGAAAAIAEQKRLLEEARQDELDGRFRDAMLASNKAASVRGDSALAFRNSMKNKMKSTQGKINKATSPLREPKPANKDYLGL